VDIQHIEIGLGALVAVGTIGAVIVALFHDYLKPRPRISMKVLDTQGHLVPVSSQQGDEPSEARYFHLKVTNTRRGTRANGVQIFLTHIQKKGPDDRYSTYWVGDLPMRWRHQEVHPLQRVVGPDLDCDLCSVHKDGPVRLETLLVPGEFQREYFPGPNIDVVLTFQARSIEVDSKFYHVRIAWDGKWPDQSVISTHLVVDEIELKNDGTVGA